MPRTGKYLALIFEGLIALDMVYAFIIGSYHAGFTALLMFILTLVPYWVARKMDVQFPWFVFFLIAMAEFNLQVIEDELPLSQTIASPPRTWTFLAQIKGAPPAALTLAAYGYMAELARQAALELAYEHEIFVELVVPTRLAPFAEGPVIDSVQRTGRLLILEEGTRTLGSGAELAARVVEKAPKHLKAVRRLAARETPVPASRTLEKITLSEVADIVATAGMDDFLSR